MVTLAGSTRGFANGTGTDAQFANPISLAIDPNDNVLVTDHGNAQIRRITPQGLVSTVAKTDATVAGGDAVAVANSPWNPRGIACAADGTIYVLETAPRVRHGGWCRSARMAGSRSS